jgi:hypothetical protein
MGKSGRKKTKRAILAKKTEKAEKRQVNAAEHVRSLLELHKLQGVLLKQLETKV